MNRVRQHRGAHLRQEGGTAVPAEGRAATVHSTAGATLSVDARLSGGQQSLHLAELGVGLLQLGGPAGEHVETVVVAYGHLVGEAAEIPGKCGDALGELVTAPAQLGHRATCGDESAGGHERKRHHPPPPVSIGWAPSELTSSSCFLPVELPSFLSLVELGLTVFAVSTLAACSFSALASFVTSSASAFALDLLVVLGVVLGVVLAAGAGVVLAGVVLAAAATGAALVRPSTFSTC